MGCQYFPTPARSWTVCSTYALPALSDGAGKAALTWHQELSHGQMWGMPFSCSLAALTCCWQLRCSARLYAKLNIKEAGFRRMKEKLWTGANVSPSIQLRVYQIKHVCCVCLSLKNIIAQSRTVCRLSIIKIIWTRQACIKTLNRKNIQYLPKDLLMFFSVCFFLDLSCPISHCLL